MTAPLKLEGKVFGRLTVLHRTESNKHGKACWICLCECGEVTGPIPSGTLKSGHSRSCGCLHKEYAVRHGESKTTHGESHTRLHRIWSGMKQRCYYKKHGAYENYGGRGIKVSPEWKVSYTTFRDWSLGNGYSDELTIDRIDNDGDYEPGNCKWSTYEEQGNNKRDNVNITYKGVTRTAARWSRKLDVEQSKIYQYVANNKPIEELFND